MKQVFPVLAALLALAAPARPQQPLVKVPPGFRAEVVLQAPHIEAPTALCVAPNGDVYFAEDPMDMAGPPTKNLDRIWLLKGGDPQKRILIADHMWAVMGLEIAGDKLYAVNAPHVTVFTLDADGKAKDRRDLFTDLGPPVAGVPSFNDHIPSGIRMGMDGWLYVSIGDKGIPKMTRKETDDGSVHVAEGRWRHVQSGHDISLEGGGVIRFRPDGSGLEVFASGTRNHLDVPLDEDDRIFVRDNTDDGDGWNTRFMYLPPNGFMGYPWAFKQRPEEALPMIHDFGGGSPCQGWVYLDDGLPETYRGRVFHCEWGQGKVWAVKVVPDGAGFRYVDQIAFMDPDGTAVHDFRPFSIRPTADGRGFYVTDWGLSGWLQNKKLGRLWKVTYTGDDVKPAPRGKDTDSVEQLIKALDHPAHSERLRAQRALVARGQQAVAPLAKGFRDGTLSVRAMRHALWVLRELRWPQWAALAMRLTEEQDDSLIYNAIRVLGTYDPKEPGADEKTAFRIAGELVSILDGDSHAPNRLQAAVALARVANAHWCKRLLYELGKETDPFVRYAAVQTLKRTADWKELAEVLPLGKIATWEPGQRDGLFLALAEEYNLGAVALLERLAGDPDAAVRARAVAVLARVHHDRKPYAGTWWGTRPEQQKPPARVVVWEGTARVRKALLKALADPDAGVRRAAVAGLRALNDPAALRPLTRRFAEETDTGVRADIVRAVAALPTPEAAGFLEGVLGDAKTPESLRLEAVAGLERSGTPAAAATLAHVVTSSEPPALQVRALEALGDRRAAGARPACEVALKSDRPDVRRAAALALGKLGDAGAATLLLPLLQDRDNGVRVAAIQALGDLKAKAALPALLQAAAEPATQFDAVMALTKMPDARALGAYLTGLGSRNADLRKASAQALAAVHEQAAPALEQMVKRNEVRPELLPELRNIYSAFTPILSWRLIGPFPNDGKSYPPEREQKWDAVYDGAEKEARWRTGRGNPGQHGKVNLARIYSPNTNVVAYGYAEIDAPAARAATLLIGSDDSIVVWLNGKKVHEHPGDRGWRYDEDKVAVNLEAGTNRLLIECGNHGGPWEFSVAVSDDSSRYAFLQGGKQKYDLEAFRRYAREHAGDPERGRRLFMDLKGLACVKCHAVGGQGGQVGPDLAGIGLKYKREDLITSVLEPSKVIAQGYETIVVTTDRGVTLTGVFKGETADAVHLTDAEGKAHTIAKADIEERSFSPVSTMPNGLSDGMTLQDFADIIAFLESRREVPPGPKR